MIRATCDLERASTTTWDAIVVGAGPAGALAARQLAGAGARVLLLDSKAFPRSKVCGACLNGRALAVLAAVGLDRIVPRMGGISLEELHLHLAGRTVQLPLPAGAALSRSRFDAALVSAAIEAGAHFLPETRALVAGLETRGRRVELNRQGQPAAATATATARTVLVANGLGHPWINGKDDPAAQTQVAAWSRIGAGCTVAEFPDIYEEQTIFMAVGERGYVGLVRVEDGRLNVAAAFDRAFLRSSGRLGRAAALVLAEAGLPAIPALAEADWQGTVGLTRRTRTLAAERVFLLGDATGYIEPFTGEGMSWALTSAHAVTPLALRAIAIGDWESSLVREWESVHHRLVGRRQHLCRGLALLLRHPRLDRLAFALVARAPGMARMMIEHVNAPRFESRESWA
jgi:flavin-dependent dehydrogenase